jgi:uncharacterized protein
MIDALRAAAGDGPAGDLLEGLFGPTRRLYKRVIQCSLFQQPELYQQLARRPYEWLVHCAERFAAVASGALGRVIAAHEILFDAPPQKREVEFQIEVHFPKEACYRQLGDVSPVVKTLARQQFDDYVKRVRVFAHARVAADLRGLTNLPDLLAQAIDQAG